MTPEESTARVGDGRAHALGDEPINSREEDRLGRSTFAEVLARALIEYPEASSLVVALYGDWGSGGVTTGGRATDHPV